MIKIKVFSLGSAKTDGRFMVETPFGMLQNSKVSETAFTGRVLILGRSPSIFKTYDASVPYSSRIETVIEWLKLPEGTSTFNYSLF
jgi:hypothetical protein